MCAKAQVADMREAGPQMDRVRPETGDCIIGGSQGADWKYMPPTGSRIFANQEGNAWTARGGARIMPKSEGESYQKTLS